MIILDTDFLSAFLKIGKLDLIKEFYGVRELVIPTAVQREIAETDLINLLNNLDYVKVTPIVKKKFGDDEFRLGEGEKETISLARLNDLVLMDDKKACEVAEKHKIKTVNIPGFLLSLKRTGFTTQKEINDIIEKLRKKDYYSFRKEDEKELKS